MTGGRDPPLEIEDQMIDIGQTLEIEIGKKEAIKNHPDHHHAITLRIEATDPLPRADSRGILLVKVTEGEILEEEVAGILLEMAAADQTLETGPEIHPNLTTEGHQITLETVIIVGMGRGMIEMDVVIEVFPRKDKEIEEEVRVEEEVEKLKKVKIVMVS